MDVSSLSTKQLEALLRAAQKEKRRKEKRKSVAAVRKLLEKAALAAGYTLSEVLGTGATPGSSKRGGPARGRVAKKAGRGTVAPKYRNPDDASQTWTGRGKRPRWLAAALEGGSTLDRFLISLQKG